MVEVGTRPEVKNGAANAEAEFLKATGSRATALECSAIFQGYREDGG
jgi:hypothetical protein